MAQIEDAVKIAEVKYSREKGYRLVFIFNHSSCHGAYSDDALNAYKMKSTKVQTLGAVMRHAFRYANGSHGSVRACMASYNRTEITHLPHARFL